MFDDTVLPNRPTSIDTLTAIDLIETEVCGYVKQTKHLKSTTLP